MEYRMEEIKTKSLIKSEINELRNRLIYTTFGLTLGGILTQKEIDKLLEELKEEK